MVSGLGKHEPGNEAQQLQLLWTVGPAKANVKPAFYMYIDVSFNDGGEWQQRPVGIYPIVAIEYLNLRL